MGIGCGSNSSSQGSNPQTAVFVTGEDAPLPSVVGFNVTLNSVMLNGKATPPPLISTPTTVDFARLVGLRSPLAFSSVPANTYSSATIVLSSPVIDYITLNPSH